jgi:hypothetical protein
LSDIIKGVLSGSWTLITGWMLPAALGLTFFGVMVLPSVKELPGLKQVAGGQPGGQAITLLTASIVLGLTLASLATPLYRVLEGYLLWPRKYQEKRAESHRQTRKRLHDAVQPETEPGKPQDLSASMALERFHRYPDSDAQVAPTRLGNAIRRFEYYSNDRYQLDSLTLWSQLRGAVSESVNKEVDNARAGVDFFVCLLYVSILVVASATGALFSDAREVTNLVITIVIGLIATVGSYRAAVSATDAWASAVRAMVDLGRVPLATALGLHLPDGLEEERLMWLHVGTFVGFAYNPGSATLLDPFRAPVVDGRARSEKGAAEHADQPAAGVEQTDVDSEPTHGR